MAKDKGEDKLEESVEGLGRNRLRRSQPEPDEDEEPDADADEQDESPDSEQDESPDSEQDESPDMETAEAEETEPATSAETEREEEASAVEWTRTTLYLQEGTKRDLDHYLKRLSLDHRVVDEAQQRELHEALVRVATSHTDEFLAEVESLGS